jgi:hypothetical protein
MVRAIILLSCMLNFMAPPSWATVLCFHSNHGLRIETNHINTGCIPNLTAPKSDIQKDNASCTDILIFEKASLSRSSMSVKRPLTRTVCSAVHVSFVPVSEGADCTVLLPRQPAISRHIAVTILRI